MRDPLRLESCLVDGDTRRRQQARRSRTVSVFFSVGIQVALLGVLVAAPLVLTAEGPAGVHMVMPVPPYGGIEVEAQAPRSSGPPKTPTGVPPRKPQIIVPPAKVPENIHEGGGEQVPHIGSTGDATGPIRDGSGPQNLIPIPGDGRPSWTPPEPPRPEPPAPQRIRVSTGVQEARLIHRVSPAYPEIPKRARLETTVELRAVIGRDGTIQELQVLSGNPLLYQETLRAVEQWRYRPTLLSGVPVEVETRITVVFRLR